jgi:hypothetical protein
MTLTNGVFAFTWNANSGSVYQVQYTTSLNSTNWVNLGGTNIATGSTLSSSDPVGSDMQRFYRVVLLP